MAPFVIVGTISSPFTLDETNAFFNFSNLVADASSLGEKKAYRKWRLVTAPEPVESQQHWPRGNLGLHFYATAHVCHCYCVFMFVHPGLSQYKSPVTVTFNPSLHFL
jgi:hypothetical protein